MTSDFTQTDGSIGSDTRLGIRESNNENTHIIICTMNTTTSLHSTAHYQIPIHVFK